MYEVQGGEEIADFDDDDLLFQKRKIKILEKEKLLCKLKKNL